MHLDVNEAFEQIKSKGRIRLVAILDKLYQYNRALKKNEKPYEDVDELMENLRKAQNEWIVASTNYEFAQEEELIDYYAYLIKASQIKYDYLLKKIKKREVKSGLEEFYNLKASEI